MVKERIRKFEDSLINILQFEKQKEERMKKNKQPQRPMEHYQVYQHMHHESLRREEK